ncbi:uncharacterized protein CC84DRAFT_1161732 [Paraphaeosphaeria sporulosa]|uniref:Rhodopsin domain-containing protein n=1 Tax=Paraphaeosphaeria sporulosa TaxID=1460663 RepID=A0A177CUJ8_9PLEO|nr:uncharacterized protein CC84DRAFT_1161732 [Paraphaeosphaeria sporulosa]OAG10916.1 hypothetical protein CC84DRAFT_1161732 [Paraphaeosphaeria sporulosa]
METLQPNVGAAISITYSAALIAFLSRFFARKWNGVPFIAGDWVSAVAFFFVTAYNILFLIKLKFGLGLRRENIALRKHDGSINYDSMAHEYFFFLYPDMWLYTAAMGMSKMTALALQWRLFGKSATRYWILLLVGCVVWWMFARCVVILAVCTPISHFWNRQEPGHCRINLTQFFYSTTDSSPRFRSVYRSATLVRDPKAEEG